MRTTFAAMLMCLLPVAAANGQQKLTYVDLVSRLTNLERLAELPQPGEKCLQCSSYDRGSRYDAEADKYVGWGANGDGGGIIRREGDVSVVAEMTGPGCIWRIWSARAGGGHVRIYLDGSDQPAVDLPFAKYFDRTAKPFVYESLCYEAARGINNYVPIPFAKSCRIVAEKGWGQYYHFTYSVFPAGTEVPTFSLPLAPEAEAALAKADAFLKDHRGSDPAGDRAGQKVEKPSVTVEPGKTATVIELTGPRAITALRAKIDLADRQDQMDALRQLVLRITWDGEDAPAVWCPLGDFFGSAPGVNYYKSLPMGMTADGFYSLWYMPFAKSATVELINDGDKARTVAFEVAHAPPAGPIASLGRFHAKWHRDALNPDRSDRAPDWTMLTTAGRGRFCGVMLHVWNPRGGWWGEGDEKLFVDGENFPSTIGTGSEDYFGYAWCTPTLFERAYHNQTISMGNRGHVSVNRWHITDNGPFQKSYEAAIEKYFPNSRPTLYAAVAYWYLAPGGKDPYGPAPVADRTGYYVQPEIVSVKGAIEGERMKVLSKTGGDPQVQGLEGFSGGKWSGDAHLWWIHAKTGDKLDLALPVAAAGTYELTAQLTKAKDYGIVQLYLDGQKLGGPIDLYNPEVVPTKPPSFGTHELTKGEHKLTVEIVGANEKAVKSYMFGLDYVVLKKPD